MARSDPSPLLSLLDHLLSRSRLTGEERQAILDLPSELVEVRARRDIPSGEQQQVACFVASGVVGRFIRNNRGERQLTGLSFRGEMPDLDALVHPWPMGGLTALSNATVSLVPHEALRSAAARFPGIAEAFWRECAYSSVDLAQWALILSRKSARTRVANLLCRTAVKLGRPGLPAMNYALPVTQDQIGEATGLTAVHVNRVLMRLRLERIVDFRSRQVQIHDWPALALCGEFEPSAR